jgi:hypothetical protein
MLAEIYRSNHFIHDEAIGNRKIDQSHKSEIDRPAGDLLAVL